MSKRSLRKLIKETCTKTTFLSNNKVYEQLDGVSMGSSLGPVMANIIMTELENTTIKPLINDNTVKFCFVDGTLLVVKAEHIPRIHNLLNQFDHNLQFTADMFKDEIPRFLDLEISNSQPSELAAAFSFAAVNAVVLLVSGGKILPPLVFQKLTGNFTFMIGEMVVYVFIDVDGQSRGNKNILFKGSRPYSCCHG